MKLLIRIGLLSWALAAIGPASSAVVGEAGTTSGFEWPALTRESRPGAYWWWLGSAVDTTDLTRELARYRDAGMGAVHIIPIYGAKGWEDRALRYLSPEWLARLRHTLEEARRLDLNVDMTTGTGWCFGGPGVTDLEANAAVVFRTFDLAVGEALQERFERQTLQALVAVSPEGQSADLTGRIRADGTVDWPLEGGPWRVFAVSQRPSGQRVKRAAPGGEGHMLNLFYPEGVSRYLRWFDEAFKGYTGPKPRAMYHDSYEYRSDWAPDFLAQFARRRGYRLETELPALFAGLQPANAPGQTRQRPQGPAPAATNDASPLPAVDPNRAARVKSDYRETVSDLMVEASLPQWTDWCRRQGCLTRNQAHGSPGNLLDLYALADIPETEMFRRDRNKLVSKLASSAAHVAGRRWVAAETGTWLKEHWTETLADMKDLLDDLFVSGVNHVFYHGTCYSPDEAGWPGWLFYASFEMNPRNPIWRDVPALNAYVARCQAVLQAGQPDHDLLVYWPLHDFWHQPGGLVLPMTVHARGWFEGQSIGRVAERLWQRGYTFDYVSDRQLAAAAAADGKVRTAGGEYRAIVVPRCDRMPVATLRQLLAFAAAGVPVLFEEQLPKDVPGWGNLEARRREFNRLLESAGEVAAGRVLVGELEGGLAKAGVSRETMTDHPGLCFIRRSFSDGRHYFIANRGEQPFDGWLPLAGSAASVVVMDPMAGRTGLGTLRRDRGAAVQVFLQLEPGESVVLRVFREKTATGPAWRYWRPAGPAVELTGSWRVGFLTGGPALPAPFQLTRLASWSGRADTNAQRFAGTALYTLRFDAPSASAGSWRLDLGRVCQSARVRLNGRDLGTLLTPPFRVVVDALQPTDNRLEVEVTNVAANRIRDLDRRGVAWRTFHDINFVNLDYKPFDASNWPLTDSGLLGPVRLEPLVPATAP